MTASRAVLVGVALVMLALAGCSSDDKDGSPAGTSGAVTSVVPSTGPLRTSTTVPGDPMSDADVYALAGLTPQQQQCLAQTGVDGEVEITPGATDVDPLVLTFESGMVAVPPTLRTGTELEQLILDTLAKDCAPPEALSKLAAIDGAAIDEAAIADDLPMRIEQRRADGATADERSCLDREFRAAPARLTSLAANPGSVEARCADAERRSEWRAAALLRGFFDAGVPEAEATCLATKPGDTLLLSAAVEVVSDGNAPDSSSVLPECMSADRMVEVAVDLVAAEADFGAETLSGR